MKKIIMITFVTCLMIGFLFVVNPVSAAEIDSDGQEVSKLEEILNYIKSVDVGTIKAFIWVVISFIATNFVSLFVAIISLIKAKIRNNNLLQLCEENNIRVDKKYEEKFNNLCERIDEKLDDIQSNVIKKKDEDAKQRLEVINGKIADADIEIDKIVPASTIDDILAKME